MAERQKHETVVFNDKAEFVKAAVDDKRHKWSCEAAGTQYFGLATTEKAFTDAVAARLVTRVAKIDKDALWAMIREQLNGKDAT